MLTPGGSDALLSNSFLDDALDSELLRSMGISEPIWKLDEPQWGGFIGAPRTGLLTTKRPVEKPACRIKSCPTVRLKIIAARKETKI